MEDFNHQAVIEKAFLASWETINLSSGWHSAGKTAKISCDNVDQIEWRHVGIASQNGHKLQSKEGEVMNSAVNSRPNFGIKEHELFNPFVDREKGNLKQGIWYWGEQPAFTVRDQRLFERSNRINLSNVRMFTFPQDEAPPPPPLWVPQKVPMWVSEVSFREEGVLKERPFALLPPSMLIWRRWQVS